MDIKFIKALAAATLVAGAFSQAQAKGLDDGTAPDRKGKGQDAVQKRGADDPLSPPDARRGRGKDDGAMHKRGGKDDPTTPPDDRRGRGRGADDPVGHK